MDFQRLSHVLPSQKHIQTAEGPILIPKKAYNNLDWIASADGKAIRILSEFLEPQQRLASAGVKDTILFFGTARSRSFADHALAMEHTRAGLSKEGLTEDEKGILNHHLEQLKKTEWMCKSYEAIAQLAERLTRWSMSRRNVDGSIPYHTCTGGGPGAMAAANYGASKVPGALNVGMGVSLPFESGINPYVTEELAFEFHYFFMRKFMMVAPCRAFIVCEGGYGSCDEVFEILTLMQSGKIPLSDHMPVVMFGKTFWKSAINWDLFYERGLIGKKDIDRLFFTDSVDEAYDHVTQKLLEYEKARDAAAAAELLATKSLAVSAQAHEYLIQHAAARELGASRFSDGLHSQSFTAGSTTTTGNSSSLSIHIATRNNVDNSTSSNNFSSSGLSGIAESVCGGAGATISASSMSSVGLDLGLYDVGDGIGFQSPSDTTTSSASSASGSGSSGGAGADAHGSRKPLPLRREYSHE